MGNVPMKKVVNSDPGTADLAGGNDWDDLVDYLNNIDKTGPVKINTRQYFRSGKLELRNPADTFSFINIVPALIGDRNINWPLLTAGDEPTFKAFISTLSNKTLDATCDVSAAVGSGGGATGAQYVTLANDATLTAERVLTAGDGFSITDSGPNGTVILKPDVMDAARMTVRFYEECLGVPGNGDPFDIAISGTAAAATAFAVAETGVFGVWELATGTTSTGRSAIWASGQAAIFSLGQGITTFEGYIKVPTLSTSGDEYQIRFGFGDVITGPHVDDVGFVYDRLTSANWQMHTKSNGTPTSTATSTVVGTGWVRLKAVVNAAGTSVDYFIGGTNVGTITTNIPVGVGRELTFVLSIVKSAGTTSRVVRMDYVVMDIDLTTAR